MENSKLRTGMISVAMATYNGEEFIEEQLNSIIAQTYTNVEIIICDDNSTDNTYQILTKYSSIHKQIKLTKNDVRLGYVKNFEKAVLLCEGEWIALADQDDIWHEDKLSVLLEHLGDSLLIHSDASRIDKKGKIVVSSFTQANHKPIKAMKSFKDYCFCNVVTGCTSLFRRELLSVAIPFAPKIPHDWWLSLCAANEGEIKYLDSPLVKYREHDNNVIGRANIQGQKKNSRKQRRDNRHQFALEVTLAIKTSKLYSQNKKLTDLLCYYYESYFTSALRPRAFLIHIMYFNEFAYKKSGSKLSLLLKSLLGKKL